MTGINPLDFSKLDDLGVSQGTRDRYQGQWEEFVAFSQISELRAPVEEDFELYFKNRREEGLSGNTLGSLHSALSSMMTHFYNKSLTVSLIEFFDGFKKILILVLVQILIKTFDILFRNGSV